MAWKFPSGMRETGYQIETVLKLNFGVNGEVAQGGMCYPGSNSLNSSMFSLDE